jgi:hypothetical protein
MGNGCMHPTCNVQNCNNLADENLGRVANRCSVHKCGCTQRDLCDLHVHCTILGCLTAVPIATASMTMGRCVDHYHVCDVEDCWNETSDKDGCCDDHRCRHRGVHYIGYQCPRRSISNGLCNKCMCNAKGCTEERTFTRLPFTRDYDKDNLGLWCVLHQCGYDKEPSSCLSMAIKGCNRCSVDVVILYLVGKGELTLMKNVCSHREWLHQWYEDNYCKNIGKESDEMLYQIGITSRELYEIMELAIIQDAVGAPRAFDD